MITTIGIGMEAGDLTVKAAKKIAAAKHVFLRSAETAAGKAVCKEYPHVKPLDDCFKEAGNFDEWCARVVEILAETEREHGEAVYLTDGDGTDACVTALCAAGYEVQTVYGVAPARARGAAADEVRLSASEALRKRPYLDTALSLHITELDDAYLAGDIKLWLMEYYADETPVTVFVKGKMHRVPLHELDQFRGYDYACELYIPAQSGYFKDAYCFGDLMRIMARLTAPDGCPWDKAQTHESIRTNLIEEAYEAVDAIDDGDIDAMTEELGDVLLQAVFHCDMGERFGEFGRADVLKTLCRKLVTRHTHIFGENKAKSADEALGFWEAAKSEEKSYVSTADKLNRLPEGFPALLYAQKSYKKLTKAEITPAEGQWQAQLDRPAATEEEFARKLFALTAQAADAGVDAEVALHAFVRKLQQQFAAAEEKGETADFLRKL